MTIENDSLVLDYLGALCPTPIIQLSKAIRGVPVGATILLKADDPATKSDLSAWSRITENAVENIGENLFRITKR